MNKIIRSLVVVAAFAAQVLSLSALAGESPNLLVNGSFENPQNATSFYEYHRSGEEGLGWQTLALDGQIEIGSVRGTFGSYARSAYGATRADDGYQFAELAANAVGALFQKVPTTPGKTYRWSWSRKARFKTEASAFWTLSPEKFEEAKALYLQYLRGEQPLSVIRPAVQALTNEHFVCTHADVEVSGDTTTWTRYEGMYTVPAGQTETYVVLVEWNGNPEDSSGCLVDSVAFGEELPMRRGIVEVYNVRGGTATVAVGGDTKTLEGEGFVYGFYPTNETLSITAEPADGYTFLGAFVSGYVKQSETGVQGTEFLSALELKTCPIHAGRQTLNLAYGKDCTVSFLSNGGSYACAETTLAKTPGSNCIPGTPTREGFNFDGWRERTTLKILQANTPIFWMDGNLVAYDIDGKKISVPAADGLQLRACWSWNRNWIPDASVTFKDGFGESYTYELKRNESMPASANPTFEHREGFAEYELVGWREPTFEQVLSTNVTAAYVGVRNPVDGGTDGVLMLMDAAGTGFSATNHPGVLLKARWAVKHTNEWAVFNASVEGGATSYFDALSDALAALKAGDTLLARPPAEGFGFGEGLKPDTNDVIKADCAFSITTDDVTVDLNGRVLNTTAGGKAGDYLMTVMGAKGVTIRNGYFFGAKEDSRYPRTLGPQACRGIKVDNLAETRVEDAVFYYHPYEEAVLVDRQSKLSFVGCCLDGEGDGDKGVVCARKGSLLSLVDCKGFWDEEDFWDNPASAGSLDNVTGEQFLIDASALVLDNTVISNSYDNTESGKALPYIVVTRGESTITLKNGAGIREGERGSTQGAIHVESGSCTLGNGKEDGLRVAAGFVIGRMVAEEGATLVAGAATYSDDPTRFLPEGGTVIVGERGYSVVVSSGSKIHDKLEYAVAASGIENIHVNKFVPYTESYPGLAAGNSSMWLKMTEGGLAKKLYLEHHVQGAAFITNNCLPDVFFPTNTVRAYVWRGPGASLTNAFNLLTTDIAKTIFDPEVVNLLTNFAPLVKSVTRGVGSATIPYVDVDGKQQFGKAVVMGCVPGDLTAYAILTNEMKRIGDGYEEFPSPGVRRFVLTNSTSRIIGSRTPSVAFGPLGYTVLCSSKGVDDIVGAVSIAYRETGKKAFYDARHGFVVAADAELAKDPTYTRNYKTDGFERFGYAYVSPAYQLGLAKMLENYGFNPAIAGTNTSVPFGYLATLCSERSANENERMRIDLQSSEAALRAIGASLRFTNLLLVNAGIVDKDFMTFDEDWKFDPETLEQISGWLSSAREQLGLSGGNYYFTELEDRTKTTAVIGYTGGKGFEQLFCAGNAGGLEENPCEACLPTNTVAAFCFQPNAAAWTELNERLFTLLGKKSEALDLIFTAIKNLPNSFGKSASIGVVRGSEAKTYGTTGGISSALGAVSSVKIEDENLWYSIRILLEQFGCKTHVSEVYPSTTICELPDSTLRVSYDREFKIIRLATAPAVAHAASVALRNKEARLISPYNKVFNDRMGVDVEAGETLPDHNTLFYFAPESDAVLVETLKEYLDSIGLSALGILIREDDFANSWACGYGRADAEKGEFVAESFIAKAIWDKYHGIFEVTATTLGQVLAEAYPYDASKARVFKASDMTFHVSRADNWDDVNHCLYPYDGDNLRVRVQTVDSEGNTFDKVVSCRLGSDGYFVVDAGGVTCSGYLSSEGVFGETFNIVHGYFIAREMPEMEAELSVLPSAEEIAEQVKKVKDAIGVESAVIGAAKSDDRTGPFGEATVVRETTITPIPGGGLDRLIQKTSQLGKTPLALYMPSNTVFGTALWYADGALTNAIAAIKYAQPELMEYLEELFGGFGFDKEILASVNDGLALGLSKEGDGLEPYFAVRLKGGQYQNWVDLTNRLYTTTGVTVTDFQVSRTPGNWEAIAFTRTDPASGRQTQLCYSRIFESADRDPVFIVTMGDELQSGIMAAVRRAGLVGQGRLVDDTTFKACEIPFDATDSTARGFTYLAPIADAYWFFDRLHVTEDGELVIKRRTSAAVAPYEASVARFAVNFFEALRGEKSNITFENDPEADKVAEEATKRVTDAIHQMRTKLGVTGLDFYDANPDEDGRYGNSELAIGTKGDGCEFLRRFAADAPASEHLVESYVPATAAAMAKGNGEPGLLIDDVNTSMEALATLVGEKYPQIAAAITNFLASEEWRISMESMRLTGTHKAMAVLQDLENPFVKDLGDGTYAGISAGYSVLSVFGPMESSMPFLLIKQAVAESAQWRAFTTNGIEYLIHNGQFLGRDLSQFVRPTFAFNAADNVMVFATSVEAARAAIRAGREGENRLIDSATFADVMGFKPGEPMREHNTLVYFAPQNDDILGCTLRRVLSPYLPESYAMLLDRPSLKGYWGGAYGVRDGDAFRLYIHAGMKSHTAFLAAGQALLKTAAESMRVRQPYDWKEIKVFRSADIVRFIEPTDEKGVYLTSLFSNPDVCELVNFISSDTDNSSKLFDTTWATVMSRFCIFDSVKAGRLIGDANRDVFRLTLLDEETDSGDYKVGVGIGLEAYDQTFPAGEKVEQSLRLWPADAKVTKTTGLPKGLSLKKTADGYFITGTPTKVGEDCSVMLTATCAGRQMTAQQFHIMVGNYASDYAELDAGYDLTAGVADSLMLTNVIGWAASGLPSGMKFDKTTGALYGTPAKPGEYVVTLTTKIDGKTEKVSTVITVDQGDGIRIATGFSDKTSQIAEDGETREIYAGVKINWPVEVKGLKDVETTLSAKGLPSGLKLVKTTDKLTGEVSYSIQGIATKASAVDKKTGEVMPSTVTLTGTNKYKWTGAETFDLVVKALPDWAIGTFNGYNGTVQGVVDGSVKVTVSSTGKLSGSINGISPVSGRAESDTFSCNGFDGYNPLNECFSFTIENMKSKSGALLRFSGGIWLDRDLAQFGVEFCRYAAYADFGSELHVHLGLNSDWSSVVFPTGKSQRTLELTDEINPKLAGLTLKFAKGGKVSVAGKVTDPETGRLVTVSASAPLVAEPHGDAVFGDGLLCASVGFVVKTATPFYAYVPVWLQTDGDGTVIEVYESDPTKDGVCSWSWGTDMEGVLEQMAEHKVNQMQLSLISWLKPSDGSSYGPSFGPAETEETFETIVGLNARGARKVVSTMVASPYEDYSSYAAITNTFGFIYTADPTDPLGVKYWTVLSNLVEQAAVLTERLDVGYMSVVAGYLLKPVVVGGVDVNADGQLGLERLHAARELCAKHGVTLLLEFGQYSAAETKALIRAYEAKYGASDLAVCFDTASSLIYGNDTPTEAFAALKGLIAQVHIADTCESEADRIAYGGSFTAGVRWGTGDVSGKYDFMKTLRESGFAGPVLIECATEVGDRASNIDAALKALRSAEQ